MSFEQFLDAKRKVNGDTLLPSTIERYVDWLSKHEAKLDGMKDLDELLEYMNEQIKKAGNNVITAAFVNYLLYRGFSENDTKRLEHAKGGITALKSHRFLQSKVLSRGELRRIFNELTVLHQKLTISALYDTACRRHELLGIKFGDIEFKDPSNIHHEKEIEAGIWAEVNILGKGKKTRKVFLSKTTVELLAEYHKTMHFAKQDKVFILFSPSGMEYSYQEHELYKMIVDVGQTILVRHIHPHCFRHTKATHMADRGADVLDIAAYLGHSNPATSAIYIEISAFRAKQAYMKYAQDIVTNN
jgi:integrase